MLPQKFKRGTATFQFFSLWATTIQEFTISLHLKLIRLLITQEFGIHGSLPQATKASPTLTTLKPTFSKEVTTKLKSKRTFP